MAFYADIEAVATTLLSQFGVTMSFKEREEATYDPTTGKTTYGYLDQEFRAEHLVNGVLDNYRQAEIDGTLIQIGDMRIYLDPTLPVNPKSGDVVSVPLMLNHAVVGHENYEVISSLPIKPAAQVVLHQLQVRRD